MTGEEIQVIIAQSAASNVRLLEIGGLRIEFGGTEPAKPGVATLIASQTISPTVAALTEKQHAKQTEESIKDDEARVKQERLNLMAIEDPLEYERLIMNGELREATDDDDEALDI